MGRVAHGGDLRTIPIQMPGNKPSIIRPDKARCCVTPTRASRPVPTGLLLPLVTIRRSIPFGGSISGLTAGRRDQTVQPPVFALPTIGCHASTVFSCRGRL